MTTDKASIWAELLRVVRWWSTDATQDDLAHKHTPHAAALAYADAVRASGRDVKPTPTRVSDDHARPFVVPFGRSKGKTLAECDTDDLRWLAGAYQRSIDDPTKARWLDANCAGLDAVNAELEGR